MHGCGPECVFVTVSVSEKLVEEWIEEEKEAVCSSVHRTGMHILNLFHVMMHCFIVTFDWHLNYHHMLEPYYRMR